MTLTANLPDCAIVDLDGTVFNTQHRQHFLKQDPPNWPAFFDACDQDEPYPYLVRLMWALNQSLPIVLCSGRPESIREKSVTSLNRHRVPYQDLYMRPTGCLDPDAIVKAAILDDQIRKKYNPLFAIDDRPSVIEMWRANGVPCLVAQGEWEDRPMEPRNLAAYHLAAASSGLMDMAHARSEIDLVLARERDLRQAGLRSTIRQFSNERSPPNP